MKTEGAKTVSRSDVQTDMSTAPRDRLIEVFGTTDTNKPPRWHRARWFMLMGCWATRGGWQVVGVEAWREIKTDGA